MYVLCAFKVYSTYVILFFCKAYLIRNIKWGSAADEVTVVVKIGGQCMVCFPEICEKIMLDHSTETLTKKVNTLKIKLQNGSDVMTRKRGLQMPHVHDTASRSCQLMYYQDLLVLLKAFNYKVPESFETCVTSLENEVKLLALYVCICKTSTF